LRNVDARIEADGTYKFKGTCTYKPGVPCHCKMEQITYFMGLLPENFCEKEITNVPVEERVIGNFQAIGICSCQTPMETTFTVDENKEISATAEAGDEKPFRPLPRFRS